MDPFDLLWTDIQYGRLAHLRGQLDQAREDRDRAASDLRRLRALAEENLELRVRLGLLVRLLVAKGVITAREYAELIAQVRPGPGGEAAGGTPPPPPAAD